MTEHEDLAIDVGTAARILGVASSTLRRWSEDGYGPKAVRIGKRKDRRYSLAEVRAFARDMREQSITPKP